MQNIEELYFLGSPIACKIGSLHFIKVSEYEELLTYVSLLNLQKFEVLQMVHPEYKLAFEQMQFIDVVRFFNGDDYALYQGYKQLFKFCFKEDVFDQIESDDEFEFYRALIRKINFISFDLPNQNPEIERFNNLKKLYTQKNHDGVTFEAMYSSVWVATGNKPANLTIYELHMLFNRICMFKNYETSILFKTVTNEVTIDAWYKKMELKQEQTTLEEFSSHANSKLAK